MDPLTLSRLCGLVKRALDRNPGPVSIKLLSKQHDIYNMLQFMHHKEFIVYHRNHTIERGKYFNALEFVIQMLRERHRHDQARETGS